MTAMLQVQRVVDKARVDTAFLAALVTDPQLTLRESGLADDATSAIGSCTQTGLQALAARTGPQCTESATCPRTCAATCNVTFTIR